MGGINFGWLAVWVLSSDWLSRKLELCDFFRRLSEAPVPGGVECGPCPDSELCTLAFTLQLRKNHCANTKPSQAKVLTGGRRHARRASRRPTVS